MKAAALDGEGVRVMLIGSGTYPRASQLPSIEQVQPTVAALEVCLREICGVRSENITRLDDPPEPGTLLEAIGKAADEASDVLLVYYVGHAVLNADGLLHLPTKATIGPGRMLARQALPFDEVAAALGNCGARSIVVVLDCCYSSRVSNPVPSGALLASAGPGEQAMVVAGEPYTAFSGEVITALSDGVAAGPATFTLQFLHAHLERVLTAAGRPAPRLQVGNSTASLRLATNRAYRVPESIEPDATPWDGPCPYPGLAPFTDADASGFHGRDELVRDVVHRLSERASSGGMTVLVGPSGSGKTSLLAAGILPAVGHGDLGVAGSSAWPRVTITPGDDPEIIVADRIAPHSVGGRVVIAVDQLEELFGPAWSEPQRRAFIADLHRAAIRQPDPVLVLLALRADFYGHGVRIPELVDALEKSTTLVGPMTTAQLRTAIEQPAREAGLRLAPGLTDALLRDTGADPDDASSSAYDPGTLPLLSHTLLTTWQHRRGNELTFSGYRESGGVPAAVRTTAERTYIELDDTGQDVARSVFTRMVGVSDDDTTADTRRRLMWDDDAEHDVLDAFARARLVTLDHSSASITHEVLIRSWPRLQDWIKGSRDDRLILQRLEDDAAAWKRSNEERSQLYRGARLAAVPKDAKLGRISSEFLEASRRQHRRSTWVRRLVAAALVLLLAGVLVFYQRSAVERANLEGTQYAQVLALADRFRATDPSTAAQFDVLAHTLGTSPNLDNDAHLLDDQNIPLSVTVPSSANGRSLAVAIGHNGILAVGEPKEGVIRLWNITNVTRPTELGQIASGPVYALAFTDGDKRLFGTGQEGRTQVWDVTNPAKVTLLGQPLTESSIVGGADGSLVAGAGTAEPYLFDMTKPEAPRRQGLLEPAASAMASSGPSTHMLAGEIGFGTVGLWDITSLATPKLLSQLQNVGTGVFSQMAFSPDGTLLATLNLYDGIRLIDVSDPGRPRLTGAALPTGTSATSIAFAPHRGRTLVAGLHDGSLQVWNLVKSDTPKRTGLRLTTGDAASRDRAIESITFSSDGRFMVVAELNAAVRVWQLPPGTVTAADATQTVAFVRSGGHSLAVGTDDGSLQMWELSDPAQPRPGPPVVAASEALRATASGPATGHLLATGGEDGTLTLWDTSDPAAPIRLSRPSDVADTAPPVVVPPVTPMPNVAVSQLDLTPIAIRPIVGITSLAFAASGRILIAGQHGGHVRLWDTTDPAHPVVAIDLRVSEQPVSAMAVDPSGTRLAAGGQDGLIRIWDVSRPTSPTLVGTPLEAPSSVQAVTFSGPQGHILTAGYRDGIVRTWNLSEPAQPSAQGQSVRSPSVGAITSIAVDPTQTDRVATGTQNGLVQIWSLSDPTHPIPEGGPLSASFDTGVANPVRSVTFSSLDPSLLVAGGDDGLVRIWNTDPDASVRWVCSTAGEIDTSVWQTYLTGITPINICPR
jgi:WD40 repeat protein/energy-coupling factor transporter ATP-binding protein EcfA2